VPGGASPSIARHRITAPNPAAYFIAPPHFRSKEFLSLPNPASPHRTSHHLASPHQATHCRASISSHHLTFDISLLEPCLAMHRQTPPYITRPRQATPASKIFI